MKVDDIDSIVHLLKSISVWGMLFILLVILPLYIAAWAGIMKLLKLNNINTKRFLLIVFTSFSIALIMLKIGVSRDQQKRLRADRVKRYLTTYGYTGRTFTGLIADTDPTTTASDYESIIQRFPEDFTVSYFRDSTGTKFEKGLMITDKEALTTISKLHDSIVPVAYIILKNSLAVDSSMSREDAYRIDDRFTDPVLELLAKKFPGEFTLINSGRQNIHYLKRIK